MRRTDPNPRYAQLAAKALARRGQEEANATGTPVDRTAAIAAIDEALRARKQRRVAGVGWGVIAAAAVVVLVIGWQGLRAPAATADSAARTPAPLAVTAVEGVDASIETATGTMAASAGNRITAGTWVRVPSAGRLLLALDSGTRLRVGASSRARVTELGAMQRFDLERGTLSAEVAKLPPGGRFVIGTADAEIEVRGTRFDVVVDPGVSACAPFVRTRVVVHEGVVAVRFEGDEVRLTAGSTWPNCATPAAPPAPPPARIGHARAPHAQIAPPAGSGSPAAVVDSSTLAEQNDLFAAALAARRRGDAGEAIRWLDRLIARYPNGQLIDSARAERQRLIESGGGSAPSE